MEIHVPAIERLAIVPRIGFEPTLVLQTGHHYVGFGIGFNLIAIGAMALLIWTATGLRRS
jgi:hypothetical protein